MVFKGWIIRSLEGGAEGVSPGFLLKRALRLRFAPGTCVLIAGLLSPASPEEHRVPLDDT